MKQSMRQSGTQVLLVSKRLDTARPLVAALREQGLDVEHAEDSFRAREVLSERANDFGAVVLDAATVIREGYNLAETIRCDATLSSISVATISETDADSARIFASAGLIPLYRISLPVRIEDATEKLLAAIDGTHRTRDLLAHLRGTAQSFQILESCRFKVRTLDDIEQSVYMAAACFSQPDRAVHGLQELLLNAVEHGNLNIGFRKKTELLRTGRWVEEVEARLASEEYGNRVVDFAIVKRDGGTSAVITDEGTGFDWKSVLGGKIDAESFSNGRGISRARLISFDKLVYNESGNRVVAFMRDANELSW